MRTVLFGVMLCGLGKVTYSSCPRCQGPEYDFVDPASRDIAYGGTADARGTVHLRTSGNDGSGCDLQYYNRSLDGGVTWMPTVRVDLDPTFEVCGFASVYQLFLDNADRVYLAMSARAGGTGPETLVVKVSADRGGTWPAQFTPVTSLGARPVSKASRIVAAPDGRAWIFWYEGPTDPEVHLYLSRSNDGGGTWSSPERIDTGMTFPATGFVPARTESGALLVYAEYTEGAGRRLRLLRSEDDGITWPTAIEVDDLAGPDLVGIESSPGILALPGNQVVVFWSDSRAGERDYYSRVSFDDGQSFVDPPVRVDLGDAPGTSASANLLVHRSGRGPELAAGWLDLRSGIRQVLGNFSPDGGLSWGLSPGSPAFSISTYTADSSIRNLAMSGHTEGWLTAVWGDNTRDGMSICGRTSCPRLYAATSCDGGRSWEPDRMLVVNDPTNVNYPYILGAAHAADSVLLLRTNPPTFRTLRLDGPTSVVPRGPTRYCAGNDPLLEAAAASAACTGGLSLQWYVDGAPVAGATGRTYQPALPAGLHTVEVRGACSSVPSCQPASVLETLDVRAPMVPLDIGNRLRAVKLAAGLRLDWTLAPRAPDGHSHLRRAFAKGAAWTPLSPDPWTPQAFDDAPPPNALVLYDARHADICETESMD